MNEFEIIWPNQAKNSLKEIYDFYKMKSLIIAKKIKNELLASQKPSIFLNNISWMILTQNIEE